MTLPGKSRTIEVEPIEVPGEKPVSVPEPERRPEPERAPEKAPAGPDREREKVPA